MTACSATDLLGIQPNSAALFYRKIREVIVYYLEQQAHEIFGGAIELDESYFGGVRKGKRGRGAAGKVVVFGILKRGGKVYTKVVTNTKAQTLMPLISRKIAPDSVVYTDCYRSYNALDVSGFYHERINHSKLFGRGKNHINGIENRGVRFFGGQLQRIAIARAILKSAPILLLLARINNLSRKMAHTKLYQKEFTRFL